MAWDIVRRSVAARSVWFCALAIIAIGLLWLKPLSFVGPVAPIQIYQGIWYSCHSVDAGDEGSGLAHIVRIDLDAPGIELYVTPVESRAARDGTQYTLTHAQGVVGTERLAVVINGTQFAAMGRIPLPGTPAQSSETLVADGHVNHVHPHSFLLWFDDSKTPHLETRKPPRPDALRRAQWGISGVSVAIHNGRPRSGSLAVTAGKPDRQSCIGIDPRQRLLWLAVFENASGRLALQTLADAGVREGIRVDGGDSTTMVIGAGAADIDAGTLLGGKRPVPTFFGVRALPMGRQPQ